METIEDVLMVTTVMEHSRFFCYMAKQIESHKGITNIRTVEKVMPQQISSNGFAGGCFLTYAVFGGISPLTCTIFDPVLQPPFLPIFGVLYASALRVFHSFLQIGSHRAEYCLVGHFIQFCRITAHVATRRLTRRCLCRFLSIVLSLS